MQGQEIDVTDLVKSGKFKTSYCHNKLDRLIETNPTSLDIMFENNLQSQFSLWVNKYNQTLKNKNQDTLSLKIDSLFAKTKYQYSYIINTVDNPIKVYRTDIFINEGKQFKLFIRADNDNILFPNDYKANGWIINECDSVNSIVTDLP